MHMRTQEDPEIYQIRAQNQAQQSDWPKKTWKKCPIKVIQATVRVRLSLSPPVGLSTCAIFFFVLTNPCYTTFYLCGNSFLQSQKIKALSLTTGLVARIWYPDCLDLTSISGQGTEAPSQAAASRDQPRSFPHWKFLTSLSNQLSIDTWVYFWTLTALWLIFGFTSGPQHTVLLLLLHNKFWNQEVWVLQLCSSFIRFFWLFSICWNPYDFKKRNSGWEWRNEGTPILH